MFTLMPLAVRTDACEGSDSAAPIARVAPSLALVSPSVVAGEPSHQFLRVPGRDVFEKGLGAPATQRRRVTTVMADHHLFAPHGVHETVWTGHDAGL